MTPSDEGQQNTSWTDEHRCPFDKHDERMSCEQAVGSMDLEYLVPHSWSALPIQRSVSFLVELGAPNTESRVASDVVRSIRNYVGLESSARGGHPVAPQAVATRTLKVARK